MALEIKVEDGMVHITFPVDGDEGLSASKKTRIVASSRGNARVEGTDIYVGLNAFRYPDRE